MVCIERRDKREEKKDKAWMGFGIARANANLILALSENNCDTSAPYPLTRDSTKCTAEKFHLE
jgi:hypothetical protein